VELNEQKGGGKSMRRKWIAGFVLLAMMTGGTVWAQSPQEPLTLEESVKIAVERNLRLHSAIEGVSGSKFRQKQAVTNFLPQWTGQYGYTRYSYPAFIGNFGGGIGRITGSRDVYNFNTTVSEPLFTGGLNLANYRLEKFGVDISKADVETVKRDIVVQVREGYFNILRADKFVDVARQAVKQFEAQLEVSKAFFEVGIIPKNDLLQSEVRLASARQGLVRAENDLALAKSSFNLLLRRDINEPLNVVDILEYKPAGLRLEDSIEEALRQRPEIKSAGLRVDQANESVKIARSGFFPTVSLAGNYSRSADEHDLQGDLKSDRWTLQALVTLTLFDWGKTAYKVGESKVNVTQAADSKTQLIEGIIFEVKQDYLNLVTAERNIEVSEKAIEQAEENLRMNEERYKYQVATATDVLDAVTLLAQARVDYYSALSDFNIAKARLDRAVGRMYP
jgi:outer membrane protein